MLLPRALGVSIYQVGEVEAGRLDDFDGNTQTGAEPQDRARIAGDVWLIERDGDRHLKVRR